MPTSTHRVVLRSLAAGLTLALASSRAEAQTCPAEWSAGFEFTDVAGTVFDLLVFDEDGAGPGRAVLFVGGQPVSGGGISLGLVGRWDGQAWSTGGVDLTVSNGNRRVWDLEPFDDDGLGPNPTAVYAAGDFTLAEGSIANCVARWDGAAWSAVGTGFTGSSSGLGFPSIRSLTVFDEDGAGPALPALFAAGDFTNAGGVGTRGLARWNGTNWSSVGGGIGGGAPYGSRLCVHDADGTGPNGPALYLAGAFSSVGGALSTANLGKWNGTTWSAVGTGTQFGNAGEMASVDFDGAGPGAPLLFLGGGQSIYGGAVQGFIARWNGSSWATLGGDVDNAVWALSAIDEDGAGPGGDVLYAGGEFTLAGALTVNGVARWNGSAWSAMGSGLASQFTARGRAFARYDADDGGPVSALLYVGGEFVTAGGQPTPNLGRWNFASWLYEPGRGLNGPSNALHVFDVDGIGGLPPALYAGGEFTLADGALVSNIASFDGVSWSDVGSGTDAAVLALAEFDDDDTGPNLPALYAGGAFTLAGGASAGSIARWDGANWSPLGSGMVGSVSALCVFDDDAAGPNLPALYAGGSFSTAGGVGANSIARWGGAGWSSVGTGVNFQVYALAVFDTDGPGPQAPALCAGGNFTTAGGVSANGIAKWNGTSWSALGTGLNATVYALFCFDEDGAGPNLTRLFAGGGFTTAGGVSAKRVARWNGSSWSALGAGLGHSALISGWEVRSLCAFDDDAAGPSPAFLFAGGDFPNSTPPSLRCTARWDGASWNPLGTDLGYFSVVRALAVFADSGACLPRPSSLFVAGAFSSAGGNSSQNVARWGRPACAVTSYCSGDGSLATACPCGNTGASGRGCANSVNSAGALLVACGSTVVDPVSGTDTIVLGASGMPSVVSIASIFLQGDASAPAGLVFGDGLRCADGALIRLGSKPTPGGLSQFPEAGNPSVSTRGMVTPGSGAIRSYQTYYRNASAAFCPPATFNITNAIQIVW